MLLLLQMVHIRLMAVFILNVRLQVVFLLNSFIRARIYCFSVYTLKTHFGLNLLAVKSSALT